MTLTPVIIHSVAFKSSFGAGRCSLAFEFRKSYLNLSIIAAKLRTVVTPNSSKLMYINARKFMSGLHFYRTGCPDRPWYGHIFNSWFLTGGFILIDFPVCLMCSWHTTLQSLMMSAKEESSWQTMRCSLRNWSRKWKSLWIMQIVTLMSFACYSLQVGYYSIWLFILSRVLFCGVTSLVITGCAVAPALL